MLSNLKKYQLILASNSPRRKELMSGLGVEYVVRTLPDVDESYPETLVGAAIPEYISIPLYGWRGKCSVSRKVGKERWKCCVLFPGSRIRFSQVSV